MAIHDHKRGKGNMKEKDELSKCVLLGDEKKIKTGHKIWKIKGCEKGRWPNGSVGEGVYSQS